MAVQAQLTRQMGQLELGSHDFTLARARLTGARLNAMFTGEEEGLGPQVKYDSLLTRV